MLTLFKNVLLISIMQPAIKSKFICQVEHDETEDKILNDKNENMNKNTKLSIQMDTHQYLLMH